MNIILEYADKGSLEDYFRNESAPSRGVDIIKFWESMFQLIKGLKAIHSVREWVFVVLTFLCHLLTSPGDIVVLPPTLYKL